MAQCVESRVYHDSTLPCCLAVGKVFDLLFFLHFFQYITNFLLSRLKHKTNFHIILSFMLQRCSWKNKPENIFVFMYRVFYFSMDVCKWLWQNRKKFPFNLFPELFSSTNWYSNKVRFFTYVTETCVNLSTYSRRPWNYNGTINFEEIFHDNNLKNIGAIVISRFSSICGWVRTSFGDTREKFITCLLS